MYAICTCVLVICAILPHATPQLAPPANRTPPANETSDWQQFKTQYGKTYATQAEEDYRASVYRENAQIIAEQHELYFEGQATFRSSMNMMGDLTNAEFIERYLGGVLGPVIRDDKAEHWENFLEPDPDTVEPGQTDVLNQRQNANDAAAFSRNTQTDLRDEGCATPVQSQTPCGTCTTFSETAVVEYHYCKKGCGHVDLSEQQPVDCSPDINCKEATVDSTWEYIEKRGGLSAERDYPWTQKGINNKCKRRFINHMSTIGYVKFSEVGTELEMADFMDQGMGPIAVIIDFQIEWRYGSEGVLSGKPCSKDWRTSKMLHALTIFGKGTDANGLDFWIVKNSWGVGWNPSMGGYAKVLRNDNAYCIGVFPSSYLLNCERKFDCRKNNPCTRRNRKLGRYYFPSLKGRQYYVQCGISRGMCWVRWCGKRTRWDPARGGCVHKRG